MASALGPQIWRGVRETALLARPLGLSHIPAAICQKTDGGEAEAGERGGTGLASYHTLDLPTFSPPEELFLAPNETCAHNQAGISLVGDVCFHWGPLPLCSLLRAHRPGPELGAGLLERPLLDCERRAALILIIISCLLKAWGAGRQTGQPQAGTGLCPLIPRALGHCNRNNLLADTLGGI